MIYAMVANPLRGLLGRKLSEERLLTRLQREHDTEKRRKTSKNKKQGQLNPPTVVVIRCDERSAMKNFKRDVHVRIVILTARSGLNYAHDVHILRLPILLVVS